MIVIAHSYFLRNDPKQLARAKPYAPLATLLTAGLLRQRRHPVAFFDAMLSPGIDEYVAMLDDVRPEVVAIVEDNFNYLTKMCTTRTREATLAMIRAARRRGARVVVNGSDSSDRPAIYFAAGADAVLLGESEMGVLELADLWTRNADASLAEVPGLVLPDGTRTPGRSAMRDLDVLPLPAWDLIDVEAYRDVWINRHGRFSWNMVTSRGCPYGCNWCAKPVFGRRYTQRSAAAVAAEMRHIKNEIGADHIWFADDIFGLTAEWIADFARAVAREGAETSFMIQSRVNLMRPDVVSALAAAGAEEVWLGVESGSQKILDAMDKGTRVEEARAATRALKARGIRACWFIQLGYPSETWSDVLLTRDLIREERPDEIGVSVSYPLPGTKFHDNVVAELGAKRNWEHTDDLAMLFHGTYNTSFYRRLRDALHREVTTGEEDASQWTALAQERSA